MHLVSPLNGSIFNILVTQYPTSSRSTIRSWIKEGRVQVDGEVIIRADQLILKNQKIVVGPKKHYKDNEFPILYEDKHFAVVEKPQGMLSVATAFEKGKTVHALLKERYKPRKVFVVHRLDQETSGVMLFALSEEAYVSLKDKFKAHEMERIYVGIVEGHVQQAEATWRSYLYEDSNYFVHSNNHPEGGSLAVTHYHVVKSNARFSRLEFKLETGRKNQIRVHCQAAGHPIVGDKKYGSSMSPIQRVCLHAHTLAFTHPINGNHMHFVSPIPANFDKLI